ncbi:hypothetical protein IM792_09185 [Mucilaginibacter sp. JRF]|uniref:hypothetical protein n=1 Tax=Mucilaginibacter sp. JRF TaxID=2780088 RepID=UPI001880D914|nr:hypothetical protein [Mucilaginibacter sp. JRF]MBE9584617.1 hypothetical protein [Mucilaginibacter sp. JRF]
MVSCNPFKKDDLVGKKLYLFKRVEDQPFIAQFELDFKTEENVSFKWLCCYQPKVVSKNNEANAVFIRALKQLSNTGLDYTFHDGVLNIPNSNLVNLKLTESKDYYVSDSGDIFYKKSILTLSQSEKLIRLQKNIIDYRGDIEKDLLNNEIVVDDIIKLD